MSHNFSNVLLKQKKVIEISLRTHECNLEVDPQVSCYISEFI